MHAVFLKFPLVFRTMSLTRFHALAFVRLLQLIFYHIEISRTAVHANVVVIINNVKSECRRIS